MDVKTVTANIKAFDSAFTPMSNTISILPADTITTTGAYTAHTITSNTATAVPDMTTNTIAINNSCGAIGSWTIKATPPALKSSWNTAPKNFSFSTFDPCIIGINIIVPNKVVEVIIYDGNQEYTYKQVCREPDVFDLKYALALAWVKHKQRTALKKYQLTAEGMEYNASRYMTHYKESAKEFDRAIKAYNRWKKEQEKIAAVEEERKAIIARRQEKNRKRREKAKKQAEDHDINLIAEAIRRSKE